MSTGDSREENEGKRHQIEYAVLREVLAEGLRWVRADRLQKRKQVGQFWLAMEAASSHAVRDSHMGVPFDCDPFPFRRRRPASLTSCCTTWTSFSRWKQTRGDV